MIHLRKVFCTFLIFSFLKKLKANLFKTLMSVPKKIGEVVPIELLNAETLPDDILWIVLEHVLHLDCLRDCSLYCHKSCVIEINRKAWSCRTCRECVPSWTDVLAAREIELSVRDEAHPECVKSPFYVLLLMSAVCKRWKRVLHRHVEVRWIRGNSTFGEMIVPRVPSVIVIDHPGQCGVNENHADNSDRRWKNFHWVRLP